MFNATRMRRSAVLGALACALLGATSGAVAAAPPNDASIAAARAQERYLESYGQYESSLPLTDKSRMLRAARAQERYYSSYGEPEPIAGPVAAAPDNGTPWPTIVLAAGVVLAATSIAGLYRRRRRRHRVARATA